MDPTQCRHAPCPCPVTGGAAFCSERCQQLHEAGAREACLCGHAACVAAMGDRATAGAEDESTDSDADASLGPGDPDSRGGTREP
jgi:hypothetical protein